MLLEPYQIYILAVQAIPKAIVKYPVPDELMFAKIMVALCFQESCLRKQTEGYACFDSEARPYDKKHKRYLSSARGLTQVLDGTQRNIEKFMKWPQRPLDDRFDPQYALDLGTAYIAYHYNHKATGKDWWKTLVSYHQGHYKPKGGNDGKSTAYANLIYGHLKVFDWDEIYKQASAAQVSTAAGGIAGFARQIFEMRQEFR